MTFWLSGADILPPVAPVDRLLPQPFRVFFLARLIVLRVDPLTSRGSETLSRTLIRIAVARTAGSQENTTLKLGTFSRKTRALKIPLQAGD